MNENLLKDLILAAEQQISAPETLYVKQQYDRLISEGIHKESAMTQIAICLGETIDELYRSREPFDEAAYKLRLTELPFPEEKELENNK